MAVPSLGNTNVSSLLRSAQAGYDKAQTYDDSIAAFEYDLSEKSADDLATYQAYLDKRQKTTTDPSKLLSLQKTSLEAERTYRSAEIFRQSLAVNYGDIDNSTKYQNMLGLYQDAVANGDYNQAQSIEGQLASLSVTIQNERDAAASSAKSASDAAVAASTAAQKAGFAQQKNQLDTLQNAYEVAQRTGQPVKNPDGSLAVDPSTGKSIGYITPQNFQSLVGAILKQKEAATVEEINTLGDDSGALTKELTGIQSNPTFLSYNSAQSQQNQTLKNMGLAAETQADGTLKWVPLGKSGTSVTGKDANGLPLFTNTFDVGKTGDSKFVTSSAIDNQIGSPVIPRLEHLNPGDASTGLSKGQKDSDGLDYYFSSKTGDKFNRFDIKTDNGQTISGKGLAKPVAGGSIAYQKNGGVAPTPQGAGKVLGIPGTEGDLYNIYGENGAGIKAADAVNDTVGGKKGLLGLARRTAVSISNNPALDAISNGYDFFKRQQAVKAAQAAAAAKAESDRKIQSQILAQAAQQNAVRAAAQSKTPSVLYSSPVQTPAQKVASVAAAGGGSPAAVAKGIGAAVGYNDILKKLGW